MSKLFGPLTGPELAALLDLGGPVPIFVSRSLHFDPDREVDAARVGLVFSSLRIDGDASIEAEYVEAVNVLKAVLAECRFSFSIATIMSGMPVTVVLLQGQHAIAEFVIGSAGWAALHEIGPDESDAASRLATHVSAVPDGEPVVVRRDGTDGEHWFALFGDRGAERGSAGSPWEKSEFANPAAMLERVLTAAQGTTEAHG